MPLPILTGVREPELDRSRRRFAARPGTELAQDGRDVVVDRLGREEQALGDVAVAQAVRDQLEDLELAGGQQRRVLARRRPWAAREVGGAALAQPAGDDGGGRGGPEGAQLVERAAQRPFVVGTGEANSYLIGGALAGLHVRIGAPEGFHPAARMVERATALAAQSGGSVLITDSAAEAAVGADVLATDTWVSMGQENDGAPRLEIFRPYSLDAALLARAAADAIVLHCLPAYRGKEIAAEVIDGPHSVVWDEAENRRHVQKAILAFLDDHARVS